MKRASEIVGNVLADWKNAPWWPEHIVTIFYLGAVIAFLVRVFTL